MKRFWSSVTARQQALGQIRSVAEAFLFLKIFLFAASVPLLTLVKPNQMERLLQPPAVRQPPEPEEVRKIVAAFDTIVVVTSPLVNRGCLTRTLTLYYFLGRIGLRPAVRFGIREVGGEFEGHCWLVQDGEPFLEKKDPRPLFREIYGFPNAAPLAVAWSRHLPPIK